MLANFAAAAVLAGVAVALVDLDLAVFSGEAGPAGAGVAALTRVGARGVVLARLVVGAVIQVWSSETGREQSESVQQTKLNLPDFFKVCRCFSWGKTGQLNKC